MNIDIFFLKIIFFIYFTHLPLKVFTQFIQPPPIKLQINQLHAIQLHPIQLPTHPPAIQLPIFQLLTNQLPIIPLALQLSNLIFPEFP